jgi:hypothetical protein
MTDKKPWAHLDPESDRAELWLEAYGSLSIPIESAVAIRARSPLGVKRFYKVDLERLSDEQLAKAIASVAERFGYPVEEVREGVLNEEGLPVLTDDVTVSFDPRLLN